MFRSIFFAGILLGILLPLVTPARARQCKDEPIVAEGKAYASRPQGALPSSLVMWKRAVRQAYGSQWESWQRAEQQKLDCRQVASADLGELWICTRSAMPCDSPPALRFDDKPAFPGRLERGQSGETVRQLQNLLQRAGLSVTVDGEFGDETWRAVRDFQRLRGLDADGIVGPTTWAAL